MRLLEWQQNALAPGNNTSIQMHDDQQVIMNKYHLLCIIYKMTLRSSKSKLMTQVFIVQMRRRYGKEFFPYYACCDYYSPAQPSDNCGLLASTAKGKNCRFFLKYKLEIFTFKLKYAVILILFKFKMLHFTLTI